MKKIVVSAIAVAAMGASFLAEGTASATRCAWEYSPYYAPGLSHGFTTTEGDFSATADPGFPANESTSNNSTGNQRVPAASCTGGGSGEVFEPTRIQAWAFCSNFGFTSGPVVNGATAFSVTSTANCAQYGLTVLDGAVGIYEW